MAKHIREEGNEKLLLFITFDLPFDEITDVHHCRDKKASVSDDKKNERKPYRVIPDVNSCHVGRNPKAAYFSQGEKTADLKKKYYHHQYFSCVSNGLSTLDSSEVQLWVTKPTATEGAEGAAMSDLQGTKVTLLCHYSKRLLKPHG